MEVIGIRSGNAKQPHIRITEHMSPMQKYELAPPGEASSDLDDGFALAGQLLEMEHQLYRNGMKLWYTVTEEGVLQRTFRLLLDSLLSELTVKEAILAHWRVTVHTISPDMLRLYARTLLTHQQVTHRETERLMRLSKESR